MAWRPESVEGLEALAEGAVGFVLGVDELLGALGQFGDAELEFGDGGVPFLVVGLAVFEKVL